AFNSIQYHTLNDDPNVIPFATLYDTTLYPEHNTIAFYTWGSQQFSLPIGATSATLIGNFPNLKSGDVLAFVQVKSTTTGLSADANSTTRCFVRLETVSYSTDPLYLSPPPNSSPLQITEITWSEQDALPFEVIIASIINHIPVTGISEVYGNMVLA